MQITLPHEVTYDFDERATIDEVIRSLKANERLVRDAFAVLENCLSGIDISSIKVDLREVSQESPLKELVIISVLIGFQEDLEQEVPEIIKALTGVTIPDQYDATVTTIVVAVVLYAALMLVERITKGRAKAGALREEYDRAVHVAGDLIQVAPDQLAAAIEERMGGKRRRVSAKTARDFFMPAKRHRARSIMGRGGASISSGAIDEIPSELDEEVSGPVTDMYVERNTEIQFRAHDLDKEKAWAAVVPLVSEDRKRLHLDPSISPELLFAKKQVRGDVQVHVIEDDTGEMVPFLYILERVVNDDAQRGPQEGS